MRESYPLCTCTKNKFPASKIILKEKKAGVLKKE
jgi:hypothetical protein